MANKLKIFEKLGLIEKKEPEVSTVVEQSVESIGSLLDGEVSAVESSSTITAFDEPKEESGVRFDKVIDHIIENQEVQTPLSSVNPVLQGAYEAILNQTKTQEVAESKPVELPKIIEEEVIVNTFKAEPPVPTFAQSMPSFVTPTPKEPTKEEVEKKLDAMIESYERNKLLSIEDIYRKAALIQEIKTTVFMVDVYAKALPENLPMDIKRESVLNIMKASDIKVDDLLSDAYKRIDALNNILESVVQATEELRTKNTGTIRDLERRIEELKRTMLERDKFQETQNTMIEYEIQRIINIVDFVKPK